MKITLKPFSRCELCRRRGHSADEHPLSRRHPQYDPFYDATDSELAAIVAEAMR